MAIKRYVSTADTTITNAYAANLQTRGTGSNMGASDVAEVFSIYGQASSSAGPSSELSRALYKFPVETSIAADRATGDIPVSGSVEFYLRIFNAKHSQTLPTGFTITATAVSRSWDEGVGLDMEEYTDLTYDDVGANWINSEGSTSWSGNGGDFHTASWDLSSSFDTYFDKGNEDLEINISPLVEQWLDSAGNVLGSKSNYGLGLYLSSSHEADQLSYYTKKFFTRGTEFFFKRPVIEARWDSSKKDNRANFFLSSSLATAADNLNTLYFYNRARGRLRDIPALGATQTTSTNIYLSVYPSLGGEQKNLPAGGGVAADGDKIVTGSWVSTGIYKASFAYTGSEAALYDVWSTSTTWSPSTEVYSGSAITVDNTTQAGIFSDNSDSKYVFSIKNLKSEYLGKEKSRLKVFTRKRDWNPAIYTKATSVVAPSIVEDVYYKIIRANDNLVAVDYGTGSAHHTRLSYDVSGSYFDLDCSILKPEYTYAINFLYYDGEKYNEQPETFKFKVK